MVVYLKSQDIEASTTRKKRRVNKSAFTRSLVGASLEVLAKKRNEKPEVRAAAREAALREIKERAKKAKGKK